MANNNTARCYIIDKYCHFVCCEAN